MSWVNEVVIFKKNDNLIHPFCFLICPYYVLEDISNGPAMYGRALTTIK